jgi:hypothetical protein
MSERSWSYEALPHQDHTGQGAAVASGPLAVLPGLRDDAAGLITIRLVLFDTIDPAPQS